MKTMVTAWFFALLLYFVTPYVVSAQESSEVLVWQGRGVAGEVCISVNETDYNARDDVLVWVLSDGETADWQTIEGEYACIPVPFSRKAEIRAQYDQSVKHLDIVEDATSPFVTIELPL